MIEAPANHPPTATYVWYVILLLTAINALNLMDRMALAVLAPSVQAALLLSDSEVGLLVGFAFLIFYAICGVPVARWADRGIRRNIVALAIAVWSTMTALSGAALNFWHLLLARVGVGAGEAGSYSAGASILCDYVPLKKRSGALAIYAGGNAVGVLLGMGLAGWLGDTIGWRSTFFVLGLPGIALALAVRFTLREPPRTGADTRERNMPGISLPKTLCILWGCRTYRMLVFYWAVTGFVQYGLIQWWPSFYARSFALNMSSVGVHLGIAVGIGQGIGAIAGGFIANKLVLRNISLPVKVGAVATTLVVPMAAGVMFSESPSISTVLVFMTQACIGISSGPVLAAQYSAVDSSMRATAGAVAIFFTSVFGGIGTAVIGFLSDLLAPSLGIESLRYSLLPLVCLFPLMALALLAAARSLPNDLAAIDFQTERRLQGQNARSGLVFDGVSRNSR